MKRTSILLAALAIILAGCSKDESAIEPSNEPVAFVKGQKVTISASADLKGSLDTRVAGSVGSNITFTWEEGDELKVTVGGSSAIFTLKSGKGTANAEFEGEMPAGGTTFTAEYGNPEPPENLLYNGSDKLPLRYNGSNPATNDAMYFKKEGCTIGSTLTLEPQFSVMQFSFYGDDVKIDKVDLSLSKDLANFSKFTVYAKPDQLTLSASSTSPTKINFIVPTGTYQLLLVACHSADYYNGTYSEDASFSTFYKLGNFTLSNTSFLYMPAKHIGLTMTPANLKTIIEATNPTDAANYISAAGFTDEASNYHFVGNYYYMNLGKEVYCETYFFWNLNTQTYSCSVPTSNAKAVASALVSEFGTDKPTISGNPYLFEYSNFTLGETEKTWSGFFSKITDDYFDTGDNSATIRWVKSGSQDKAFKLLIKKIDGLKHLPVVSIGIEIEGLT